ncbi:allantoate amidohydrolase [Spirosoma endophyticum]|uniref:Allantoate deiminase n=1 Tax=Spirosoma endophyticum TaxID=662367 RepID=A0A1I1F0Y6_9BACT|nr:allantoate amidohydrolase [Spirosoma endophyticum]SFB92931.1 allantoate deiminase [Spirosoma endophyticum]
MTDYQKRAKNVLTKINELAAISDDPTCVNRTFGTTAFQQGSRLIQTWMQGIGLQTRVDAIGNVRGRFVSPIAGAKTFVIASHMDTVVNAGKFDGPMGVLMGLDLIENLIRSGETLPFTLELIAFSDEEGVRFHTTYLGSKVVAGSFDTSLLDRKDESGTSLGDLIQSMGGVLSQLVNDAVKSDDWLGYFEIHIEQGPVLYERNVPMALVTAIAGQKRVEITFTGMAGHAGTVPMDMRQDALCAAAEFILEVERFGFINTHNLVATVGKLNVVNAASNVIPGEVVCSLDVRSHDVAALEAAYQSIQTVCANICAERSISFHWNLVQETAPVACDPAMNELLAQSITESHYDVIRLVSGAGHDGVPISQVSPIAMLFVRCFKGISHNPLEDVDLSDMAATLRVADTFMNHIIELETSRNGATRRFETFGKLANR